MAEHLFKLKKEGKTVGYCKWTEQFGWHYSLTTDFKKTFTHFVVSQTIPISIYPFVTKDKNGKDVFASDEVLVYKGKENIGEGYVDFNERFLWWVVNNSNQDDDRESPQDWSQLSLCDVDIELIEDKDDE